MAEPNRGGLRARAAAQHAFGCRGFIARRGRIVGYDRDFAGRLEQTLELDLQILPTALGA
jgi:hypothetical protein